MPRDRHNPSLEAYTPEMTALCLRLLATLIKAADGQRAPRLVVIGGLAPSLLLDAAHIDAAVANEPHPGTTDVDVCVRMEVAGDPALYTLLEGRLGSLGFHADTQGRDRSVLWRFLLGNRNDVQEWRRHTLFAEGAVQQFLREWSPSQNAD